jgi:hypothetical protein
MPDMSDSELQRSLGGIEAKLNELLRRAENHDRDRKSDLATGALQRQTDISRIAALELWRSYTSGALVIVSLLVGFVYKLLASKGIL